MKIKEAYLIAAKHGYSVSIKFTYNSDRDETEMLASFTGGKPSWFDSTVSVGGAPPLENMIGNAMGHFVREQAAQETRDKISGIEPRVKLEA